MTKEELKDRLDGIEESAHRLAYIRQEDFPDWISEANSLILDMAAVILVLKEEQS